MKTIKIIRVVEIIGLLIALAGAVWAVGADRVDYNFFGRVEITRGFDLFRVIWYCYALVLGGGCYSNMG